MQKLDISKLKNSQGQRSVADPQLNEQAILADLDRVSSITTSAQLKNGAKLAVIDGFDRQPNRDYFAELVTSACSLQANLSRLEFAAHMQQLLKDNKLDADMLERTVKSLTQVCEERRADVVKLFKPVTEMRHSTDAVH